VKSRFLPTLSGRDTVLVAVEKGSDSFGNFCQLLCPIPVCRRVAAGVRGSEIRFITKEMKGANLL